MGYLLIVVVAPILGTGGGAALLAGAFARDRQPQRLRILGALVLLLATGLWILATAAGGGYGNAIAAFQELILVSATALVGAGVLILKAPAARRVAGVLLITAYPMLLVGFALAGSALSPDTTHIGR